MRWFNAVVWSVVVLYFAIVVYVIWDLVKIRSTDHLSATYQSIVTPLVQEEIAKNPSATTKEVKAKVMTQLDEMGLTQ